jgi:hypothetical protein
MRKIIVCFLMLIFIAGISGTAFAQVAGKKAELAKISKYIKALDSKIINYRKARRINKVAEVKELKRQALSQAKELKAEIARLEAAEVAPRPAPMPVVAPRPVVAPSPPPAPRPVAAERRGGLQAGIGYGGGGGILEGGYSMPLARFDLDMNVGYGMGSGYSIMFVGIDVVMPLGDNHAGLELGMANYSHSVADIMGAGTVNKGSNAGVGIFAGRDLGGLLARIGYNSALGLTAGVMYKF